MGTATDAPRPNDQFVDRVLAAAARVLVGRKQVTAASIVANAGGLNLGGSIETVHDALDLVELAIEKGATSV